MFSRPLIALLLGLATGQLLNAAGDQLDTFQGLLSRSPFGTTGTNQSAMTPTDQPLEFHAVLEENGRKLFSIYERTPRRSSWVDLNQPVDGFIIREYDDAKESIAVVYQGKSLTLFLKGAKPHFQTSELAPVQKPTNHAANEYYDKPFRLGHVLEEKMIRDAMRQDAAPPVDPSAAPSVSNQP